MIGPRCRILFLTSFLSLLMVLLSGVALWTVQRQAMAYAPAVPRLNLTKTVGLMPGQCATTSEIELMMAAKVHYCFEVINTGDVTLTIHTLTDSHLGNLITEMPLELAPGLGTTFIFPAFITRTTVNTATWTALPAGSTLPVTDTDTAVVSIKARARHVALLGDIAEIDFLEAPHIEAGDLQLIREFPNPSLYLNEALTNYFPNGVPVNLTIRLYEFPIPDEEALVVLQELKSVADTLNNAYVEDMDLSWLSYRPGQLMATGACRYLEQLLDSWPGLGLPTVIDLDVSADPSKCTDNTQIRLYPIADGEPVILKRDSINSVTSTVAAQADYLLVGAMSQDYIAGSPAGPIRVDAAPWSISPQSASGKQVRVVVFDTEPFGLTPGDVIQENYNGIPLTISYPYALPPDLPQTGRDVTAHGTFVSSAAMDVAPDADFHLVRVLNEQGIGSEFTFLQAARQTLSQTLAVSPTLAGVVFNYSFVLELTATQSSPAMAAFLSLADAFHITQVAAAGNDSAQTLDPVIMPLPARDVAVIGVSAVTWDSQAMACYANKGEVAIWGGGMARDEATCYLEMIVNQCANNSHPEYCVVGWDPTSSTNYAYGLGTSFAAPLVAGLAAQDIEAAAPSPGEWPDPDQIRARIHARVTHNPAPNALEIGAIGNPYMVQRAYLPFVIR